MALPFRANELRKAIPDGTPPSIESLRPLIERERDLFFAAAGAAMPPMPARIERKAPGQRSTNERLSELELTVRLQNTVIEAQNQKIALMISHFTGVYTLVDLVSFTVPGEARARQWTRLEIGDEVGRFQTIMNDAQRLVTVASVRMQSLIGLENRRAYLHTRWDHLVGTLHRWWQQVWWVRRG